MRWLMVSQDTPREALGGTELYVLRLSEALLARGMDISWVHHSEGHPSLVRGASVDRSIQYFEISARHCAGKREQSWRIDPIGLEEFQEVLHEVRPDCVHFHGFGRNQSPEHFIAAKQAGATVLMTYHSPGQSCARWDLLHKNREMCSGKIVVSRCTDCALHRLGVPAPARAVLAQIDLSQLGASLPYGAQHPFMRRRGLVDYRRRWMQGMAVPDRILWHAEWVRDLLLLNGISEDRLFNLPLPPPRPTGGDVDRSGNGSRRRKFIYIGRLIDIKGVHVITEAVRRLPRSENLEVLIIGAKGPEDYLRRIEKECAKDPRLRLLPPVAFDEIPDLMRSADAVIVPSLWPETGPYTVLEALWTGTPVIGSDSGGICELLSKWGRGVLFKPGSSRELSRPLVDSDFRAMRQDPVVFQSAWLSDFDNRLQTLCESIAKGRTPGFAGEAVTV